MTEKYLVHLSDGGVVAMKHDLSQKTVTVGGLVRFRRSLESILTEYLKVSVPQMRMTQRNKIRFSSFCTKKKFDDAMDLLQEHGVVVENVSNLGRVMR